MLKHHSRIFTFVLFLILILGVFLFFQMSRQLLGAPELEKTRYGITFSTVYAKQLGLDPRESYLTLVEDLGVRAVRLPVYWSEVEIAPNEFDWALMDQLIDDSEALGVKLTLVVGTKVPRWPECYTPDWAEMMSHEEQHRAGVKMIEATVNRYKNSAAIERWQVENEPFFPFGTCVQLTQAQFEERVDLVRRLDPTRPIQVTVSGELGPWTVEKSQADVLGISMYRLVWNDLFGYFMYPLVPEYYYVRAQMAKRDVARVIISELQAEPWFPEPIERRTLSQWYQAFDADMFENNLQFVENAHLPEVYLWGAEWWVLMKENGDDRLWEVAKNIF
jgi:hypothetical protein